MMTTAKATFAAGCFWGVEDAFRQVKGVKNTVVGYMGGHVENPTYEEVCTDLTGHAEVVEVEFDPKVVSFDELLNIFFKIHDPTTRNRQGPDIGIQYRSAIFFHNADQEARALAALRKAQSRFDKPIVTEITPAGTFYPAEDYHQQYYEKRGISHCRVD